ncbi:hypothetical protein SLEP1_g57559 [Rubroshorea leprosula]|uniref:Protein kinase domain-containing protein n=1 Tax=Rubroshorea leprosula TaxID=152421 RepID=A0AAV5MP21_9ROSI|nr:hypothetical protein SLEP1_g57559 [Rubroshorea leprosula]
MTHTVILKLHGTSTTIQRAKGFIFWFTGVECWHYDENRVPNIQLSDMSLKGQFPRRISGCSSLVGLDLSNNELSGPIPSDISSILPYLTTFKLSSNKFSGEIPKSLANISFLNVLNLDHNQLAGRIPPEIGLLSRIKTFTVADYLSYGPVPNFSYNFSSDSFANNPVLCGEPLEPRKSMSKPSHDIKNRFLVGLVGSAVLVITVFISCYVVWTQRKKRSNKRKQKHQMEEMPREAFREESKESSILGKLVSRLNYTEISEATKNFSEENVIGIGRMGTTYKAVLPNGWLLAVKRLHDTCLFDEHFITELKTLGRMRNENLLPLLGFCIWSKERLLVYKYMSKGILYDWLHPEKGEARIMEFVCT